MNEKSVRLTELAACAGWAGKLSQSELAQVLGKLPTPAIIDKNVLVGHETGDDAAIYRIDERVALVLTTDFFAPIVDDPFD